MIDGDPKEFIDGLYYGYTRFYKYRGHIYYINGYCMEGFNPCIEIYELWVDEKDGFHWVAFSDNDRSFPVEKFENAKIFDGKTFWEVEQEITWMDDDS